ncbi:MAG: hypothetical protein HYU66_25385 [Armatimonadetes bacterium]|nr:hypothetical protein [Armatimonadota bacterium]
MTALLPLLALTLQAARPEVTCPPLTTPPTVDGTIHEDEWSGAVRQVGLVSQHDLQLTARQATFWFGSDGKALYLALRTELPPGGELLNRAVPDGERDVVAALRDDSVELVLHPHLGATTGDQRYFHLIANPRGALFDRVFDDSKPANRIDTSWRMTGWTYRTSFHDGWWDVEIAVPFESIGATAADLAHPWGLRICRNWQRGWDQSRWETASAAYEDLDTMPRVRFAAGAPVTQILGLSADGKAHLTMALVNPGAAPLPVRVLCSDTWSRNPPHEETRDLTLPAGGRQELAFDPPHGGPEGAHHTVLQVTSPDGGTVYYLRHLSWKLERPAAPWTIVSEDRQAIGLQYAVYPSYGKLHVRVDIGALASKDQVTGVKLAFGPKGGKPLLERESRFRDGVCDEMLDLPELPAGDYEVRAALAGEGVPTDPVIGLYERRVFPWEHNKLGLSDRVIPPFTPIAVQGNGLSTVLRRHTLNGAGLWDQVASQGHPLLTAPMRWVAGAAGKPLAVTPGKLAVVERLPHRAVIEGSFDAGRATARVRSVWDYDGLAKVTVRLPATPGAGIDRLSLEIPLDDRETPYLHACGDGLRFNYAGRVPAGEGIVWDSSKTNRTSLVGTFYPYVWVGGGERGLVYCADTDRDWSLDEKTPTVQLERRGGTLLLRLNLVTRDTPLDRERSLEFGLQATPVKPMPEQPVNWRRWMGRYYEKPKVQPFTIVGASYYYGCLSFDFYPVDHDLSIYDAFSRARDSGKPDLDWVEQWMERYKPYVKPDDPMWNTYHIHVQSGMHSAAGTPRSQGWLWTPYTNPRGIGFQMAEWPTFQDEWVQSPWQERAKVGGLAYEICPTRSFQDCALWSYREMLKCFDGIYWDNLYLSANTDPVAGGAWTDEQGRVHPSMGLWAMRDLVRRTAVMMNEEGRPVFANVVHMTNADLVPIMAFANVNLDWEWQYGKRDWQDRFDPDLTVAETIGRQCGNIPLVLAGGFYDAKDPAYAWCTRTRTGVCAVHEIRVWDWQPQAHYDLYQKLFDFGYGDPACRVFNYWDAGFPLKVEGVNAKAIVMVNGARALVIVTDYGKGGECRLTLDLKALGLPGLTEAGDLETGEAIALAGTGAVSFPLKKHDYRAVELE